MRRAMEGCGILAALMIALAPAAEAGNGESQKAPIAPGFGMQHIRLELAGTDGLPLLGPNTYLELYPTKQEQDCWSVSGRAWGGAAAPQDGTADAGIPVLGTLLFGRHGTPVFHLFSHTPDRGTYTFRVVVFPSEARTLYTATYRAEKADGDDRPFVGLGGDARVVDPGWPVLTRSTVSPASR